MYSSPLNAMDKIYKTQLLNIISSLHKHELLRSQKLLETSRNECTVAFLFSKHALINKGLSAQTVSPPPPPSDFAFIKWRGKCHFSVFLLPFVWLEHRKVPDFILHKPIIHSCDALKCSGGLCWGYYNTTPPPERPGVLFHVFLDCQNRSRSLKTGCPELESSHIHMFGQCREGRVLTGEMWKRRRQ